MKQRRCYSCGKKIRKGEHVNVMFCSKLCSDAEKLAAFLEHLSKNAKGGQA